MKRTIIIWGTILIIIVVAIVSIGIINNRTEETVKYSINEASGEIDIEYPNGVAISIPKDWQIRGGEKIEDGLYASRQVGETRIQFWLVSRFANVLPAVEEIEKKYSPYSLSINVDGETIKYYGNSLEKKFTYVSSDEAGEIAQDALGKTTDYIEGKIILSDGNLIEAGGYIVGPDYVSYISTCNKTLDSIEKI